MDTLALRRQNEAYFGNTNIAIYLPETEESLQATYQIDDTTEGVLVIISAAYQPNTSQQISEILVLEKPYDVPTVYDVVWVSLDTCTLSPSPAGIVSPGDLFSIDGSRYEVSAIDGDNITFTTPVSELNVFYASVAVPNVAYQWELSEDGGSTWSVIPGATDRSYAPISDDVGDQIRVIITYEDGQGTVESPALAPPESQPLVIYPVFPEIADISLDLNRVYQANVLATLSVVLRFSES